MREIKEEDQATNKPRAIAKSVLENFLLQCVVNIYSYKFLLVFCTHTKYLVVLTHQQVLVCIIKKSKNKKFFFFFFFFFFF